MIGINTLQQDQPNLNIRQTLSDTIIERPIIQPRPIVIDCANVSIVIGWMNGWMDG